MFGRNSSGRFLRGQALKRFQFNGHTIGFHPQTQKLELHFLQVYIDSRSERVNDTLSSQGK